MAGEASITGVATAVPLFVGYTECAADPDTRAPLYGVPFAIGSMAEFRRHFGGPAPIRYGVQPSTSSHPDFTAAVGDGAGGTSLQPFDVVARPAVAAFNLYWQMLLFFANGGGECVVVSAGSYWTGRSPLSPPGEVSAAWTPRPIAASELIAALAAGGDYLGATMIVVPETCLLEPADYAIVAQAMLAQAGGLGDRMAILDPPGCRTADTIAKLQACQSNLWEALAPQAGAASYGAAYAPALAPAPSVAATSCFPRSPAPTPRAIRRSTRS